MRAEQVSVETGEEIVVWETLLEAPVDVILLRSTGVGGLTLPFSNAMVEPCSHWVRWIDDASRACHRRAGSPNGGLTDGSL